jgi:rhamnulokinase
MPRGTTYLAFDLGASNGRAVLGTLVGDRMHMDVLHRFATPTVEEGEHLFWDVEGLWQELTTGLALALDAAPELRSLSVDSWAVDYVPLNADGTPLRRPYCYRDPRTSGTMERAFDTLGADRIYALTGIQFLPFNTLFQVLADADEEDETKRHVYRYLPIADYFNYRFGGRAAVEVSMASTTQLMDVRTRQWAAPIFAAFGLDMGAWPPIVPSGSRLGHARDAPNVTVVASCSHDTGSAVAAAPVTAAGTSWAFVSSGTWSLLGVERSEPLLTRTALEAGFTHEAGVDGTLRFLKNLTGLWPLQECVREWSEPDWSTLESEAREAPPGLAIVDLEAPRFLAPGRMTGRIQAYCEEHGHAVPSTRGQLVRVILESIAASYRAGLDDLRGVTGQRIEVLHVFGGGSRNRLLCQLAADACAVPVVAGPAEATALGNLLLQARTMGDLPGDLALRDVAARSSSLDLFTPTTESSEAP